MKNWLRPLAYSALAITLGSCAKQNSISERLQKFRELEKTIWNADTLMKESNEPLYQKVLTDSITQKPLDSFEKIESEYVDLKLKRLVHYDDFIKTKNYDEGLKAIAYSQYIASRFPGEDGKELETSALVIEDVSKKLGEIKK